MKYDSAFQREGGGEHGHLPKHTHKSRRSALPLSQAYAPSSSPIDCGLAPLNVCPSPLPPYPCSTASAQHTAPTRKHSRTFSLHLR